MTTSLKGAILFDPPRKLLGVATKHHPTAEERDERVTVPLPADVAVAAFRAVLAAPAKVHGHCELRKGFPPLVQLRAYGPGQSAALPGRRRDRQPASRG